MCGISTASIMTSRIQKTLQSKYFKFYSLSQTDVRTITILHLSTLIIKNGKFADKEVESSTVVPGFSVLGFRALPGFLALCTRNQIWIYVINLPGFSALPGFKAPFHGNRQSVLNPGTTVFTT